MIKKISAILLALVLCLSVVVVPASAMDLDGSVIGYEIKFDKEYYNPGDEAVVSVYVNAAEGYELGTFMISIGFQSSVFAAADNSADDIKASAVSNSAYQMLYADITTANIGWSAANIVTNIKNSCTAEEKALYDAYLCIQGSRDSGSAITNKNGLPTEDLNADEEPFVQFTLVVSDEVAEGTAVSAAVTTGSIAKNRTYFNYYKNPGNATTIAKISTLGSSKIVAAEATIGEEPSEFTPLTVSYWKDQIRFDKKANGTYFGTFDYRMLATIDNFDEVIGTDYDKVTDVGFIFNKGAAIDEAKAKAQVEGGAKTYSQVSDVYVSTAYQGKTYVISCLVNNIADADKTTALSSMAYVEYVVDGVTYYAYSAVTTSTFEGLYNTYYSQNFGA